MLKLCCFIILWKLWRILWESARETLLSLLINLTCWLKVFISFKKILLTPFFISFSISLWKSEIELKNIIKTLVTVFESTLSIRNSQWEKGNFRHSCLESSGSISEKICVWLLDLDWMCGFVAWVCECVCVCVWVHEYKPCERHMDVWAFKILLATRKLPSTLQPLGSVYVRLWMWGLEAGTRFDA